MSEEYSIIETLRDFVSKVNELGIEYMVTGSFAMSAYGEIRMTRDVDIVVQLERSQAGPFARRFENEYYVSEDSIRRAVDRQSMFNVISQSHGGKVDCIVMKDSDFARESFRRRWEAEVSGVEFWVTTKEDLIVAKLNWARDSHSEMQIRDIANLISNEYDAVYVERWVERLTLQAIWSEVAQWKTQREKTEN